VCPATCQYNDGSTYSEQNNYTVNANGATPTTSPYYVATVSTVELCIATCQNLALTYPIIVRYMYYIQPGGMNRTGPYCRGHCRRVL